MRTWTIPKMEMIGRNDDTDILYTLEENRQHAIRASAKELARLLGHTNAQYFSVTIPLVLLNILDSYEPGCGIAGAEGYLRYARERFPHLAATEDHVIDNPMIP